MNNQDLLNIAKRAAELHGTREENDLARLFQTAFRLSENENHDSHTNGEFAALKKIADFGIKTVFDVGANFGESTKTILTIFPEAYAHCF